MTSHLYFCFVHFRFVHFCFSDGDRSGTREETLNVLKKVVHDLPEPNKSTFKYIILHLVRLVYTVHCKLYNVLYIIQDTLYNVHYTLCLCNVHCTIYMIY